MAASGKLVGLSPDQLNTILAAAQQCLVANMVRGINYTIAGRSFGFPTVADASQMILEVQYALGLLTGQRSANVRANYNYALGRGTQGTP